MILVIFGVLMLIGLVILHELGHFYAARKADVVVEEFGIGFPPKAKLLGKQNGTEYTLNWLPLGGFVRLKGEHDSDTTKGSFGAAKLGDKVKIMVAGVTANALIAIFLMTIVAAAGLPKFIDNQFTVDSDTTISQYDVVAAYVAGDDKSGDKVENSPAYTAGLRSGDVLLSLRETGDCNDCALYPIKSPDDLGVATKSLAGKTADLTYTERNKPENVKTTNVQLRTESEVEASRELRTACIENFKEGDIACPFTKGYLGVVPDEYVERKSTWSSPIVATVVSGQIIQQTFKNFGGIISDLFKGDTTTASEQVTGVIGIGYILGQLSAQGIISVIFLVAVISLSLAVMNILPIPALDGGRLFVTLLFRAFKKPLTKKTEERIHGTGFVLLMLLFVLITVVDVQRFILG